MRMSLVVVAAGVLLAASCGSDGDSVDRAELEARDAQERTEELEAQLEESEDAELREELEDLQDQLAEEGGGADDTGGNTGGGNTGGGNTGGNTAGGNTGGAAVAGGAAAGTSTCDTDLEVNSVTSCPFARNVRDALFATNFNSATLDVYSPTTGQTYTMQCGILDVPIVCTGGNNAAVYFWP